MGIQRTIEIDYAFLDNLNDIRTGKLAIGTYDESVSQAEDETIFFYFEDEEEFQEAVKNDADEFRIMNKAKVTELLCIIRKNWSIEDIKDSYSDEWEDFPSTIKECKERMESHIFHTYDYSYVKECIENES